VRATTVTTLLLAVLAAVPVLSACGESDDDEPPVTSTGTPPTSAGVRGAVQDYVTALNAGDGEQACAVLDDRGQASVIAFLPSNQERTGCAQAVERIARKAVKMRRVRIGDVNVSGRSATATVTARNPAYSSGVVLAYEDQRWKISYPPGLQTKSRSEPGPAPGVPLEQD
jgi:hypothetical protein